LVLPDAGLVRGALLRHLSACLLTRRRFHLSSSDRAWHPGNTARLTSPCAPAGSLLGTSSRPGAGSRRTGGSGYDRATVADEEDEMRRTKRHRVVGYSDEGRNRQLSDVLAGEEPLELRVAGATWTVTMRTPGEVFDLALGFLVSEGVVW